MVGRDRLCDGGSRFPGWTLHRSQRGTWAPNRGSPESWDWHRGRSPWPLSGRLRSLPIRSTFETYRIATVRMLGAFQSVVTPRSFPSHSWAWFWRGRGRPRRVRGYSWRWSLSPRRSRWCALHATAGYCTPRHALVPGMILMLAAAHGLAWLVGNVAIPGWWLGLTHERIRPGPAVWAVLISLLIMIPNSRSLGPFSPGPFWIYIATGDWLAQNTSEPEQCWT